VSQKCHGRPGEAGADGSGYWKGGGGRQIWFPGTDLQLMGNGVVFLYLPCLDSCEENDQEREMGAFLK